MAMIKCDECGSEVSSKAIACPKCGNPLAESTVVVPTVEHGFNYLLWIGLLFAVIVVFIVVGLASYKAHEKHDVVIGHSYLTGEDIKIQLPSDNDMSEEKRRKECSTAIMSNMGTSTAGYADKQAYEAEVKAKCKGY